MRTARIRRAALALPLLLAACSTTNVTPVNQQAYRLKRVCIERNPRVLIAALVPAVRDAFRRNRVPTVVREPGQLEGCEYVLRYTARRARGIGGAYTKSANLELQRGDESIGRADYARNLGFLIYSRTADEIDPLIDRMLEGQRR